MVLYVGILELISTMGVLSFFLLIDVVQSSVAVPDGEGYFLGKG